MGDVVYLYPRTDTVSVLRSLTVPLCEDPNTSTVCECGGLLAYLCGRWQHVEACLRCYASTSSCPNPRGHTSCEDPEPSTCAHAGCSEPINLDGPCAYGQACCGCCWQTVDELEGRQLWPTPIPV